MRVNHIILTAKEAERQYIKGAIVALCWHAVPPDV